MTLLDPDGRGTIAQYERVYGGEDAPGHPSLALPLLAVRPRAWRESEVRPLIPDDIREWLDSLDGAGLRTALRTLASTSDTAGFEPAVNAMRTLLQTRPGRLPRTADAMPLALRYHSGEQPRPEPDLSLYDRFIPHDERNTR